VKYKTATISTSNQAITKTSGGAGGGNSNRRYYKKRIHQRSTAVIEKKITIKTTENQSEGLPVSENLQKLGEGVSRKRKGRRRRKKKFGGKMEGSEPDDNEPTPLLQQKNKTEKQSKSANEMTTENTSTDPRSWFQGLSGEDKSISISLTEKKFIGMFLQAVDAYCPHDDDDGQDDGKCVCYLRTKLAISNAREKNGQRKLGNHHHTKPKSSATNVLMGSYETLSHWKSGRVHRCPLNTQLHV
jgi:hypothetical protein